ncbi:MAG: lantibiotic dehydratase [Streptomycetaceae bacterium]|nr:lantibiotic dehydratase [Streptomycetaceae bacterium]
MRLVSSSAASDGGHAPVFQCADIALLRAPLLPLDRATAATADLRGADAAALRSHVKTLTSTPEIHEALLVSSASLGDALAGHGGRITRRTAYAVSRYWLRMTTRTTPFGLLAGAAAVRFGGTAKVVLGAGHTKSAVPDMNWLLTLVERWQRDLTVLRHLRVVANDLVIVRDGRVELTFVSLAKPDDTRAPTVVSLRHSAPVRATLAAVAKPVRFPELADSLRRSFPRASGEAIDGLLRSLVDHQVLVTDLVPPSDEPDPLGYVLRILGGIPPEELPELTELRTVHEELAAYRRLAPGEGVRLWTSVTERMRRIQPSRHLIATDLRLDAHVTLPREVATEAERAADVMLKIAPPARIEQHLVDYHRDFLERYGTEQPVPLRTLLDPATGLGAPATYQQPPSHRWINPSPAPDHLRNRDELLSSLAQAAALEGSSETVLTDDLIERLDNGVRADGAPGFCDVYATLLARSCADLDAGDFRLLIHQAGADCYAGAFGRFARLLDNTDDLTSFVRQANPASGALPIQVSWRPRTSHFGLLARAPWWVPHRLSVGWFDDRSAPEALGLDDLVVTASTDWFHVFSQSLGREVAPHRGHMLNYATAPNPVRFLIDITVNQAQARTSWSWGSAAALLPFVPRVRYGRSVLSAARWLPDQSLRSTGLPFEEWADQFARWRRRWRVPRYVVMKFLDNRTRIDLDEPHHLDLLRQQLQRRPETELVETPDADSYGWLSRSGGAYVNELIFPMIPRRDTGARPETPPQRPARPVMRLRSEQQSLGHAPGGEWLYAKLYSPLAAQDTILTRYLPRLLTAVAGEVDRWFFLRYHDPESHLRLRFHGDPTALAARLLPTLRDWVDGLRQARLAGNLVLDTYHPELERYGGPAAMTAAEQVFHTDSTAVLAQLASTGDGPRVPPELTAAVNFSSIVGAFHPRHGATAAWLLARYPKDEEHHRMFRTHRSECLRLIDPGTTADPPPALALSATAAAAWKARSAAVARYGQVLRELGGSGDAWGTPGHALASLLHMHHNRLIGADSTSEARAQAMARGALQAYQDRTNALHGQAAPHPERKRENARRNG